MASVRFGIVMDPIATITPAKDSSLAMLLAAQNRGHEIVYFEQVDLWLDDGIARGNGRRLHVTDDPNQWYELGPGEDMDLSDLHVILMRKDPPFDTEYIYTTYILERAELEGTLIVNRPAALRNINEKVFTAWFADCCPTTLITRSIPRLRDFMRRQGKIVMKPLDSMGGRSIFVVDQKDNNANVVFETLTDFGTRYTMAQTYIPEIALGDKRILLIDGEPAPFVLARIPPPGDNRGNLVAGAKAQVRPLTDRDRWICDQVGPVLRAQGVLFAGLDVIGDYLTEVNVTSPTGIRELAKLADIDMAVRLIDTIESAVSSTRSDLK
jgi:glutathione synthase